MASPRPRRRRLLLPAAFAAILAIEVTGFTIARSITTPASTPIATSAISPITADRRVEPAVERRPQAPPSRADGPQDDVSMAELTRHEPASAATAKPTATAKP